MDSYGPYGAQLRITGLINNFPAILIFDSSAYLSSCYRGPKQINECDCQAMVGDKYKHKNTRIHRRVYVLIFFYTYTTSFNMVSVCQNFSQGREQPVALVGGTCQKLYAVEINRKTTWLMVKKQAS